MRIKQTARKSTDAACKATGKAAGKAPPDGNTTGGHVVRHGVPRPAVISGPATGAVARKKRFQPGTVALREIRKYQKSTVTLIRKKPFMRIVKPILQKYSVHGTVLRIQSIALAALQEAAEVCATNLPV